jgi:hypothetical protein
MEIDVDRVTGRLIKVDVGRGNHDLTFFLTDMLLTCFS